jgi:glycosyltransferase involved in cell wall biosynthesis
MKILMVNSLYAPNSFGGAEKVTQLLSEGLVQRGHSVVVLSTQPEGSVTTREINGLKVHYLPVRNIYRPFSDKSAEQPLLKAVWHGIDSHNPWMAKAIQNVIEIEKPDLIHTHNLSGFSVAAWTTCHRFNLPIVHTTHDHYLLCPKTTMFRNDKNCVGACIDCRLYAQPRRLASQKVDAVVGVSKYILNRHLESEYFSKSKQSQVIFNPYVGPHKKRTNVIKSPVRFGFLGRIHPTKGIEILMKVVAGLGENFELLIGGAAEDEYVAMLKKMVPRSNIKWLGFVNPDVLLENIDVLVFPSLVNETAGMVVQEALAVGVPVIASKRGGIPEVLGDGGWLFDPDTPLELESIMMYLMKNPEEIASKREQAWHRGLSFSSTSSFQQHENLYALIADTQ